MESNEQELEPFSTNGVNKQLDQASHLFICLHRFQKAYRFKFLSSHPPA